MCVLPKGCFKLSKFIIDFWSPIITIVYFSMTYFHFFILERQMSWWEWIHMANFLHKLPYRNDTIQFLTLTIFSYGIVDSAYSCRWRKADRWKEQSMAKQGLAKKIKEVLSKVLRVVEQSGTKCTPASPALPANDKNISLTNSVNCVTLAKQALLGMWVCSVIVWFCNIRLSNN